VGLGGELFPLTFLDDLFSFRPHLIPWHAGWAFVWLAAFLLYAFFLCSFGVLLSLRPPTTRGLLWTVLSTPPSPSFLFSIFPLERVFYSALDGGTYIFPALFCYVFRHFFCLPWYVTEGFIYICFASLLESCFRIHGLGASRIMRQ